MLDLRTPARLIGRALRGVADTLDPPAVGDEGFPLTEPIRCPRGIASAFYDEESCERRREAALSIMDDDCLGFTLFEVRRRAGEVVVDLEVVVARNAWPAMSQAMALTCLRGDRALL